MASGNTESTTCSPVTQTGATVTSCQTIAGQAAPTTTVITSTVVTGLPVAQTVETTLYGTSCRVITTTLPPTTITTQAVTTLSNGEVSTTYITATTTPIVTSSLTPTATGSSNGGSTSNDNNNLGAIIGGVVGGVVGLIVFAVTMWCILKRRRKFDDIWDDNDLAAAAPAVAEPKPNNNRPISFVPPTHSHTSSPSPASPPPTSPGFTPMSMEEHAPMMSQGYMTYNTSHPADSKRMTMPSDPTYGVGSPGGGLLSPYHPSQA
ncbi:hypothetical protein V5O48_014699, partial [Marasmius crinis-equi]